MKRYTTLTTTLSNKSLCSLKLLRNIYPYLSNKCIQIWSSFNLSKFLIAWRNAVLKIKNRRFSSIIIHIFKQYYNNFSKNNTKDVYWGTSHKLASVLSIIQQLPKMLISDLHFKAQQLVHYKMIEFLKNLYKCYLEAITNFMNTLKSMG